MDETKSLTPFDEMTQTRGLQMLKTLVPYISGPGQMQFAVLIQFLELQHTYRMFQTNDASLSACSIPEGTDRRTAMLNEIRRYCTPKEQETIDTLLNMFCILSNYEMFLN